MATGAERVAAHRDQRGSGPQIAGLAIYPEVTSGHSRASETLALFIGDTIACLDTHR